MTGLCRTLSLLLRCDRWKSVTGPASEPCLPAKAALAPAAACCRREVTRTATTARAALAAAACPLILARAESRSSSKCERAAAGGA